MMDFVKSTPGDDPLVVEGYFAFSPDKLFKAWTTPDIVMKWFGQTPNSLHSADIDLKPGGKWQFVKSIEPDKQISFEGEYLEIADNEKLVFTWSHVVDHTSGKRDASPFSKVEVNFIPNGNGTDLKLRHSAISSDDARRGIGSGWNASFASLTTLLGTQ